MPYKSDAQRRYFNANREELEEQGVDVDEWNESTKGKKLPEKVKEEKKAFVAPMINNMAQWMRQNFRATPGPGINMGTNGVGQQAMQGEQSPYGMMQQNLESGVGRMVGTNGVGQQFNQSPYNPNTFIGILPNLQSSFGRMAGTNGTGQRAMQAGGMNPYNAISQVGSLGKQFNPYGTGMGFNGGLGGGLNGSSVGNNMGQAAGTNAAAVPGASQMKLGADQQDTRPSAFSVLPGVGGFISGAVKENPGVKSRFASSLGEGVTGLAGGLLGGTLLGKLLGHAAYGKFLSKVPKNELADFRTQFLADNIAKSNAQGYGGLMGGMLGTNTGSRFFRDMTQSSEKQGEEGAPALDTKPSALAYVPGVGGFLSGLAKKTPGVGATSGTLGEGVSGMLGSTVGAPLGAIGGSLLGMLLPALFKAGRRPFAHTSDGVGPMQIGALLGTGIGGTTGSSIGTHAGSGVFRDLFAKPEKSAIDKLAKLVAARCWEGYEPVPGKKPYSDGSCQPKGDKSKAKEKKAFAPLEREYNAMQSGLTGADLGMRIVPGALAGGVVGGVKGLMEDPGYDDRTGKKRSRLVNILKSSLGGAVGGGVVGHLMGAPAMQFGVRKGYELGDGVSRYLSDARDKVEKLSADKRASLAKILAGTGIGGALGTLLGRYTGYNKGHTVGYDSGYGKGSAVGGHETLMNLLKGMQGVVQQGSKSDVNLNELVNKQASSGVAYLGKVAALQEKMAFRILPGRRQQYAAPQQQYAAPQQQAAPQQSPGYASVNDFQRPVGPLPSERSEAGAAAYQPAPQGMSRMRNDVTGEVFYAPSVEAGRQYMGDAASAAKFGIKPGQRVDQGYQQQMDASRQRATTPQASPGAGSPSRGMGLTTSAIGKSLTGLAQSAGQGLVAAGRYGNEALEASRRAQQMNALKMKQNDPVVGPFSGTTAAEKAQAASPVGNTGTIYDTYKGFDAGTGAHAPKPAPAAPYRPVGGGRNY